MFKIKRKKNEKSLFWKQSRKGKMYKYLVYVKWTPDVLKKTHNTVLQFQDLET